MSNEENLGLILENKVKSEDYIFQKSLKLLTDYNFDAIFSNAYDVKLNYQNKFRIKRVISENEFKVYENPNPRGNRLCSFGLNKLQGFQNFSNSENARFSSRNRLVELIKANPDFCYFFTGTFDPKKWNSKNFQEIYKPLRRFLQNKGIKYILVAELHQSGAIHFHGVFNETVEPYLENFDLSKKLPKRIRDGILKEDRKLFNFPSYANRFGWVSIEKIRNLDAVACYVSKYITKSFEDEENRISYRRFFASKNLSRPFNDIPKEKDVLDFEPIRLSKKIPMVTFKRVVPTPSARALTTPSAQGGSETPTARPAPPSFS